MEYIALNPYAQHQSKENILYSEMETLTLLKRFQNYKKIRKTDLQLRDLLRKAVNSIKKDLDELEKTIPKVHHKELLTSNIIARIKTRKSSTLEKEIESIREKIRMLNEEQ